MIVIDASVIAKLYRDEAESELAADAVRKHAGAMSAPDLLGIEVAAVLVRDGNSDPAVKSLQQAKLTHLVEFLDSEVIQLVRSDPLDMWRAANLALALGTPIKDCVYLALARTLGCRLLTADARFASKADRLADIDLLRD